MSMPIRIPCVSYIAPFRISVRGLDPYAHVVCSFLACEFDATEIGYRYTLPISRTYEPDCGVHAGLRSFISRS